MADTFKDTSICTVRHDRNSNLISHPVLVYVKSRNDEIEWIELRCKMDGCIVNSHIVNGEVKFLSGIDGFRKHLEHYHGMSVHDEADVHKWCCFRKLLPEEALEATQEHKDGTGKPGVNPT
jgi:hypothetical protein